MEDKMTISKRLKEIQDEIYLGGGSVLILYTNENTEELSMGCSLQDGEDFVLMLTYFLRSNPILMPEALRACSLAADPLVIDGDKQCEDKDTSPLLDNMTLN